MTNATHSLSGAGRYPDAGGPGPLTPNVSPQGAEQQEDHLADDAHQPPAEVPSAPTSPSSFSPPEAGASAAPALIPPPPPRDATIAERAEWWARYGEALNLECWHLSRDLGAHYRAFGPIRTSAGLVTKIPNGYDWDSDAVASVMPELVSNVEVTVRLGHLVADDAWTTAQERADRLCSILDEEFRATPEGELACDYETRRIVDATEANRVLREGGEAAASILPYRMAKGRMGVEKPKRGRR